MASCPSRIHHQLIFNPRHHALPNASASIRGTALLSNDDVLPTADASTKCFEENLLTNGVLLQNSAHMSVSSLYQFLVLTASSPPIRGSTSLPGHRLAHTLSSSPTHVAASHPRRPSTHCPLPDWGEEWPTSIGGRDHPVQNAYNSLDIHAG
jgi:hypothetical protein